MITVVALAAVLVGCALLVAVVPLTRALPRLLVATTQLAGMSTAVWSIGDGLAQLDALTAERGLVVLIGLQVLASWGVVVASGRIALVLTYRGDQVRRPFWLLAWLPAALQVGMLAAADLRPLVVSVQAGTTAYAWGPVFWSGSLAAALVMSLVGATLITVAAATVSGQRPFVLAAVASTAPAAVAWLFFVATRATTALAPLAPALLSVTLLVWLVVAWRRPGLAQLPITVGRLLAEVDEGIVVATPDGMVMAANQAARTLLGRAPTSPLRHFEDAGLGPLPADGSTVSVVTGTGRVLELITVRLEQPGRARTLVVTARDITELARLREHLTDVASRDPMTGARNRRFLDSRLPELAVRARGRFPLSVVTFDVDRFKKVNDTYGHGMGDRVLIGLADEACRILPAGGELVRTGGDEFAIVLPGLDAAQARRVATRFAARCSELQFATHGVPLAVTICTGVAELTPGMSADELLRVADRALYQTKHSRRTPPPTGAIPVPRIPPSPPEPSPQAARSRRGSRSS